MLLDPRGGGTVSVGLGRPLPSILALTQSMPSLGVSKMRRKPRELPVPPAELGPTYLTFSGPLSHLLSIAKQVWWVSLSH